MPVADWRRGYNSLRAIDVDQWEVAFSWPRLGRADPGAGLRANGIVLLYGAGEVWPHILGDFRLAVPAAVLSKYLAPQWKLVFTPG